MPKPRSLLKTRSIRAQTCLTPELVRRVERQVRSGSARSISDYLFRACEQQLQRDEVAPAPALQPSANAA